MNIPLAKALRHCCLILAIQQFPETQLGLTLDESQVRALPSRMKQKNLPSKS